jgi:hypothetical protein
MNALCGQSSLNVKAGSTNSFRCVIMATNVSRSMSERRSAYKIMVVKLRGNYIDCLVPFSSESVIFCLLSKI